MKIASLVPYKISPAVKGGEKAISLFLKHVGKYADITCFTVAENREAGLGFTMLPVLGSTVDKWRYLHFSLYKRLKKECAEREIEHLIIDHPYYGWLGYLLKRFAGLKLVARSHNIEGSRFKTMGKWWWGLLYHYERWVHRQADYNFFITEEDQDFAIEKFGLNKNKCAVVTYGVDAAAAPLPEDKKIAKQKFCDQLGIPANTVLLLFNGTLDYGPNKDALDCILNNLNPEMVRSFSSSYRILICGSGLPASYNGLKCYEQQNIIYKGFVADIELYFKAADIFINPVTDGGGIKTKLVEALAANTTAISFRSGAFGVPFSVTGNKLIIVPDNDHHAFVRSIVEQSSAPFENIPDGFFEHFNWDRIAKKAVILLENL